MANMIQIAVITLISSTIYCSAGKIYRQVSGLGIGLRASAALARITMCDWDQIWANRQHFEGLCIKMFYHYIDDIRLLLYPINKCWKWGENSWVLRDNMTKHIHENPIKYTCEEIGKSLGKVWDFLQFTVESELDFENGYLVTLDFQMKVTPTGIINYKYYAKPMVSSLLIQIGSALSNMCIVRRMYTTSSDESIDVRLEILNNMIQQLVESGHEFTYIKSIMLQRLSKYQFMVYRDGLEAHNKLFMPIHRPRSFKQQ